jgi:hypothetical protein
MYAASSKKFPQFLPTNAHDCHLIHNNIFKQDRQYTYNVTLRRVRATIVAVEKQ